MKLKKGRQLGALFSSRQTNKLSGLRLEPIDGIPGKLASDKPS